MRRQQSRSWYAGSARPPRLDPSAGHRYGGTRGARAARRPPAEAPGPDREDRAPGMDANIEAFIDEATTMVRETISASALKTVVELLEHDRKENE
jgi:hypothetical protein